MAQLVEQLIRNQQAAGSSPASSSKNLLLPYAGASFFIHKSRQGETLAGWFLNMQLQIIGCPKGLDPLFLQSLAQGKDTGQTAVGKVGHADLAELFRLPRC